jgi:hypothetical protein
MYDENFKLWAGINDEGVPEAPWGILAIDLMNEEKINHDLARDTVIMHCLKQGEIQPLAKLFQLRITPSPNLLRYVGLMMAPDEVPEEILHKQVPFGLTVCTIEKAKSKRLRSKTSGEKHIFIKLRDSLIKGNVDAMNEGSGYEAAIEELAMLEGLDKETIRSATRKKKPASE